MSQFCCSCWSFFYYFLLVIDRLSPYLNLHLVMYPIVLMPRLCLYMLHVWFPYRLIFFILLNFIEIEVICTRLKRLDILFQGCPALLHIKFQYLSEFQGPNCNAQH